MYGKIFSYSDGGARGNPGPAAIGVVLFGSKNNVLAEFCECIGKATNNVAEYRALIKALELSKKYTKKHVVCTLDSELVVRQLSGLYKTKNKKLKSLHSMAKENEAFFEKVTYVHAPRENKFMAVADKIVNKALDEQS